MNQKIAIGVVLGLLLAAGCSSRKPQQRPLETPPSLERALTPTYIENIDPFYRPGNIPIGYATPLVTDDFVYFGTPGGDLKKYSKKNRRSEVLHHESSAIYGKPLMEGDILYYGTQGAEIVARSLSESKEIFRARVDAPSESSLVYAQGRIFTALRNHSLVAMDAKTGKILWSYKRAVPSLTTLQRVPTPVIVGQKIFQGFADGTLCALRLEDGSLSWEQKLATPSKFQDVDVSVAPQGKKYLWASVTGQSVKLVYQENGFIERTFDIVPTTNLLPLGDQRSIIVGGAQGKAFWLSTERAEASELSVSKRPLSSLAFWKQQLLIADFTGVVRVATLPSATTAWSLYRSEFQMGSQWSSLLGDLEVQDDTFAFISSRNRLYIFH